MKKRHPKIKHELIKWAGYSACVAATGVAAGSGHLALYTIVVLIVCGLAYSSIGD